VRVAAASDLALALDEIARAFERETSVAVSVTLGSTGLLSGQLASGAPFDVFLAADGAFVDPLVDSGVCDGATRRTHARGRLAIVSREGAPKSARALDDLVDDGVARVAIAHPDHAPYGRAAKGALARADLLARLEPKLVLAENVRQALTLVETGNVDAALVALALVETSDVRVTPLDVALHPPIDHVLVACRGGARPDDGRRFAAFMHGEVARAVLVARGFAIPDPL